MFLLTPSVKVSTYNALATFIPNTGRLKTALGFKNSKGEVRITAAPDYYRDDTRYHVGLKALVELHADHCQMLVTLKSLEPAAIYLERFNQLAKQANELYPLVFQTTDSPSVNQMLHSRINDAAHDVDCDFAQLELDLKRQINLDPLGHKFGDLIAALDTQAQERKDERSAYQALNSTYNEYLQLDSLHS